MKGTRGCRRVAPVISSPLLSRLPSSGASVDSAPEGKRARVSGAWLLPTLPDLVFVMVLAFLAVARAASLLNADGDPAGHIAVGRYILAHGGLPATDVFSSTMAKVPFTPIEWGTQLLWGLLYTAWGPEAVAAAAAVIIAGAFALLLRHAIRRRFNAYVSLALIFAGLNTSSLHWIARPDIFDFVFSLAFYQLLVGGLGRRRLWLLPVLMVPWVNLHPGYVVGLLAVGLACVAQAVHALANREQAGAHWRQARTLALVLGACLLATALNPLGPAMWPRMLAIFSDHYTANHTVEFLSPDFHTFTPELFLGVLLISILSLSLPVTRPRSTFDLLLLLAWTALALFAARNIPLFMIWTLPGTLQRLDAWLRFEQTESTGRPWFAHVAGALVARSDRLLGQMDALQRPGYALLACAVLLVSVVVNAASSQPFLPATFEPSTFPVRAVEVMQQQGLTGPGFNYFTWGGYLSLHHIPVFVDSVQNVGHPSYFEEYAAVFDVRAGWQDVLARNDDGWVLAPTGSSLATALDGDAGWRRIYRDSLATLYVKQ